MPRIPTWLGLATLFPLGVCLGGGASLGCGANSKETAPSAPEQAVPLESSVEEGRYAITGTAVTDHCEDSLELAAEVISIDPESRTLRADVVERHYYELDVRGDELVATGQFDLIPGCGTYQFLEVWRLRPRGPTTLEGQLTTYYRDSSSRDCLRACKFVTAIKAERIGSAQPEETKTGR